METYWAAFRIFGSLTPVFTGKHDDNSVYLIRIHEGDYEGCDHGEAEEEIEDPDQPEYLPKTH
jgi:hypothetical protein